MSINNPCYIIFNTQNLDFVNEFQLKTDLENDNINIKLLTLEKVLKLLLNGIEFPNLIMTIIRFVLPVQDRALKKLLLIYWEIIPKTMDNGKLRPEMILVCDAYRKDLQHPNEYLRGSTLRFLCKLKEPELLEPLMPSIISCLEHQHSYVRRNAVMAIFSIYKHFEWLIPNASKLIADFLEQEIDISCKRNAFLMLLHIDEVCALNYIIKYIDEIHDFGEILQLIIIEFIYKMCYNSPKDRTRFVRCIYNLLMRSKSKAVRFEAAGTLLTLSSAPSSIRSAVNCFIDLILTVNDNNVKLIILERIIVLQKNVAMSKILQEMVMDILCILKATTILDVQRKTLIIAINALNERNVRQIVMLLKTEITKTHIVNNEYANTYDDIDNYQQLLVKALRTCTIKYPDNFLNILPELLKFLCYTTGKSAAIEVLSLIREALYRYPILRDVTIERLLNAFKQIQLSKMQRCTLWLLGEYATTKEQINKTMTIILNSLGKIPIVAHEIGQLKDEQEFLKEIDNNNIIGVTGDGAKKFLKEIDNNNIIGVTGDGAKKENGGVRYDGSGKGSGDMVSVAGSGKGSDVLGGVGNGMVGVVGSGRGSDVTGVVIGTPDNSSETPVTEIGSEHVVYDGDWNVGGIGGVGGGYDNFSDVIISDFTIGCVSKSKEAVKVLKTNTKIIFDDIYVTPSELTIATQKTKERAKIKIPAANIETTIKTTNKTYLRHLLMEGDYFLGTALSVTLTKLALRFADLSADFLRIKNRFTTKVMLILSSILHLGQSGLTKKPIDCDSYNRIYICLRILSEQRKDVIAAFRENADVALAKMLDEQSDKNHLNCIVNKNVQKMQKINIPADNTVEFELLKNAQQKLQLSTDENLFELSLQKAIYGIQAQSQTQTTTTAAAAAKIGAGVAHNKFSKLIPLTGYSDAVYAEVVMNVNTFNISLDVLLVNQSRDTLENCTLELATIGQLKLTERPMSINLEPYDFQNVKATLKVTATENAIIFGNIVYETLNKTHIIALNEITIDIMDYILPATCTASEFRHMWQEFEWENKIGIISSFNDLHECLNYIIALTNMSCLMSEKSLAGDCNFIAVNLYAKSVFGEHAIANLSIEKATQNSCTRVIGHIRIRAQSQGMVLGLGERISSSFKYATRKFSN